MRKTVNQLAATQCVFSHVDIITKNDLQKLKRSIKLGFLPDFAATIGWQMWHHHHESSDLFISIATIWPVELLLNASA